MQSDIVTCTEVLLQIKWKKIVYFLVTYLLVFTRITLQSWSRDRGQSKLNQLFQPFRLPIFTNNEIYLLIGWEVYIIVNCHIPKAMAFPHFNMYCLLLFTLFLNCFSYSTYVQKQGWQQPKVAKLEEIRPLS